MTLRQAYLRDWHFHLGIAITIFVATHFAQSFNFFGRHESFVWLPGGISIGLMLRFGVRTLPATCIGLFIYYFEVYELPLWASLWTATTWAAALLLFHISFHRFAPVDLLTEPSRALLVFYLCGVFVAPALHTLLDWPMLRGAGLLRPGDDIREYVFAYFLGEAYSSLLLAPSIYLVGKHFDHYSGESLAIYPGNIGKQKAYWSVMVLLLLWATYRFGQAHFYAGMQDIEFVLYPLLAYSAFRLGVIFTNLAVIIVTFSVFSFTSLGLAGTPAPLTSQTMIGLLLFIVTIAVMAQLLAALDLERRLRNFKLAYAATHDWLTDLGNVASFRASVAKQLELARTTGCCYALGYIEANEHKVLEQGYGVHARNALLKQFGSYLSVMFCSQVSLARITGGTFTVLFKDRDPDGALGELEEMQRRLRAFRFLWDGKIFRVFPTIRLAPIDASIANADHLLEWMSGEYEGSAGNDQVTLLSRESVRNELKHRRERIHWLAEIQQALERDHLQVQAQLIKPLTPKTATDFREPYRMEILVRLLSRSGEIISPGQFLPHAERYGLLAKIDHWVCTHTCEWLAAHPSYLATVAKVSMNISGQSLGDADFRRTLLDYLYTTSVPLSKLCFEITESEAISNLNAAVRFFEELRRHGVSVALDDFGTGLSSFEYLKYFCVDYIKIDGIFIRSLERSADDYSIVKAIQSVASAMHIETVAEYAENEAIVERLRELGVHYAQGFAVGMPQSLETIFCAPNQRVLVCNDLGTSA